MPRLSHFFPLALLVATGAQAQPFPGGGWGHHPWDEQDGRVPTQGDAEPSRRIDVDAFRSPDALGMLGKGRIVVTAAPPIQGEDASPPDDKLPVYEAAVTDRLAAAGYDIANAQDPAQTVELTVSRDVVIPEEARHKPVSGEMSVGVGNRGVSYGMALAVDLSKPKKAIVATRLDVRIRDAKTRRVLWEGHAQGQSRLTDNGNDDSRIAERLAHALFAKFPEATVVASAAD